MSRHCAALTPDSPARQVAANYYEKLPAYMQDIFRLTHRAAKEDEEDVAKQAIEFWCTVCEEELDIQQVGAPCALHAVLAAPSLF
jgi:importin subunit beta-1